MAREPCALTCISTLRDLSLALLLLLVMRMWSLDCRVRLVLKAMTTKPPVGFEPTTSRLLSECSTN